MDVISCILEVVDKNYIVEIIPLKIGETKAFYAKYSLSNSNTQQIFTDSNGFPYYFSNVEFLKEVLKSKLR